MNPKAFQLLLPILTLLLLLQKTLSSVNPNYLACKPFQCGRLSISYPFFVVDKQPSFCGSEGFGVSCNNQNQTIINLSKDDYIINSISYQDLSISITNSAFSNSEFGCLSSVHNLTLSPQNKFSFTSSEHKQLILLEDCSTNISSSKGYEAIKCKEDKSEYTLFAAYKDDFKQEEVGECNKTVFVSYDGRENDRIGIQGLLRKGMILEYIANNCSTCQNSGGRCGMSQDTSDFYCFCPDRDHRGSCHKPKGKPATLYNLSLFMYFCSAYFYVRYLVYGVFGDTLLIIPVWVRINHTIEFPVPMKPS